MPSVEKLASLPAIPATALRIVNLCDQPGVGLAELGEAIALDPVLSARMLRLANSAAFKRSVEITSVDRALMQLGLQTVKLTALGFVISEAVTSNLDIDNALLQRLQHEGLVEAVAAREVAHRSVRNTSSEAFLAGLFDGLGRQLCLFLEPEGYGALLSDSNWPSPEAERNCLGTDNVGLMIAALEYWGVPSFYADVLRFSIGEDTHTMEPPVAHVGAVLRVARLAGKLLVGTAAETTDADLEALAAIGLDESAIDEVAEGLSAQIADMAEVLEMSIKTPPDYSALLEQARNQVLATSLELAQASALQASQIDELSIEREQLRMEAHTDRLTGLPNRASFEGFLDSAINDRITGRVKTGALGIAMIDVDKFKSLNDTHGHQAGDRVLEVIGERLLDITRQGEMIARYGGEEFVFVAPVVTDADGLMQAAERIRRNVADLEVDVAGLILRVTVSVGAIGSSKITAPEASRALVQAADRLLYQAKHHGRNQSRTEWLSPHTNEPAAPPPVEHADAPYPSEKRA
ncbi:MAG: diguanylate cyclase [Acidimicrobiales bacterium]